MTIEQKNEKIVKKNKNRQHHNQHQFNSQSKYGIFLRTLNGSSIRRRWEISSIAIDGWRHYTAEVKLTTFIFNSASSGGSNSCTAGEPMRNKYLKQQQNHCSQYCQEHRQTILWTHTSIHLYISNIYVNIHINIFVCVKRHNMKTNLKHYSCSQ